MKEAIVLIVVAGLIFVFAFEAWTWLCRRWRENPDVVTDSTNVATGVQAGLPATTGHNNVAIGEAAIAATLKTPEERGVEVYYVDGPNGAKVPQFRPKSQEEAGR